MKHPPCRRPTTPHDSTTFDADEVADHAKAQGGDLELPHDGVIIEFRDTRPYVLTLLAYARRTAATIEAVLFVQSRHTLNWGDVVSYAQFSEGRADVEANPGLTAPEAPDEAALALCSPAPASAAGPGPGSSSSRSGSSATPHRGAADRDSPPGRRERHHPRCHHGAAG